MIFEYGSCLPESQKVYRELAAKGKNPILVKGKVKVKSISKEGTHLVSHYWVKVGKRIIDPTKNQFDKYGGILAYYTKAEFQAR